MCFPTSGFDTVRPSEVLDEERFKKVFGNKDVANISRIILSLFELFKPFLIKHLGGTDG
jgi:serine/threonine-protein kinase SRPK3